MNTNKPLFIFFFILFLFFCNSQDLSVVSKEAVDTLRNIQSINLNIENIYQKISSLLQGEVSSLESSIEGQISYIHDDLEVEKIRLIDLLANNTADINEASNNHTNLVGQLKQLYIDGLHNQTELGVQISSEMATLQFILNKKNENLLRNDSLTQVLDSQQTSLINSNNQWTAKNNLLNVLNNDATVLENEINSNLTLLLNFNSYLQTNQTDLQSLLSQLSTYSDNIKSQAQYCLLRLNSLYTNKLSAQFDVSSAESKLYFDQTLYDQLTIQCQNDPSACLAKQAASTAVSNDQYLLNQAQSALQTVNSDINKINSDCNTTLEELRTYVSDTRNQSSDSQSTISLLQSNIAYITTLVNSLRQQKSLVNIKRNNVIKQLKTLNSTISNLEIKITTTEQQLEETQIQLGYNDGNETDSRGRLDQLRDDLNTSKYDFNERLLGLNLLIQDAENALQTYVNQKPVLELTLQSLEVTLDLQNDKLQSYFDQLIGFNNEISTYNNIITSYQTSRTALNDRLKELNNVLQRTPSNGEIQGTTMIYPYFGNCVAGQPDNCTCFPEFSGTGCTECSNSSLMNIFYSPSVTYNSDPIFCFGTKVRSVYASTTMVQIPASQPDGSEGNNVYLPGCSLNFETLVTSGTITFYTSGFPPLLPNSFFPFTDYQQISGVVSFTKANVCYILPNSSYYGHNIDPNIVSEMALWHLDTGIWKMESLFTLQPDGSLRACATLVNSFLSNGDWFAIGAQICPVFEGQTNLDLTVTSAEEFTLDFSFIFSTTEGNIFVKDQNNSTCRALYANMESDNTFYLKWTNYANSSLLNYCNYTYENVSTSSDGVLYQQIYEYGLPLKMDINGDTYDIYELFSYSGAMLTVGTSYKISINAYARNWESCSEQTISVCTTQVISCNPSSTTPTTKLTNCSTMEFVMPNGQNLTTNWNCTESTDPCTTVVCQSVPINQLSPSGTCNTKIYFHVVGTVSTISGEFYSKFDTWRILRDLQGNTIDYPIEPYDLSAGFEFFPPITPVFKRSDDDFIFNLLQVDEFDFDNLIGEKELVFNSGFNTNHKRVICPTLTSNNLFSGTQYVKSYISGTKCVNVFFDSAKSQCVYNDVCSGSTPYYYVSNGVYKCCSLSNNYASCLQSLGYYQTTTCLSYASSQSSSPAVTVSTVKTQKRSIPSNDKRTNTCGSQYYPFVPYNVFNSGCPTSLVCPVTIYGDLVLNFGTIARSNELLIRDFTKRTVRYLIAGKSDDVFINFSVFNNGTQVNTTSNGAYITLQFEGVANLIYANATCYDLTSNSILTIWKCYIGNMNSSDLSQFSFGLGVSYDSPPGSFSLLSITTGVDQGMNLYSDTNPTNNVYTETFVTVRNTSIKMQVFGGNSITSSVSGTNLQIPVNMSNDGDSQATGVKFIIAFNQGFTYVSSTGAFVCISTSLTSNTFTCSYPEPINPGSTSSGVLTFYSSSSLLSGVYNVTSVYFSDDGVIGSSPSKTLNFSVNLSCQNTIILSQTMYDSYIYSGQQIEYRLSVTNTGPSDSTNMVLIFHKGNFAILETSTNLVCFDRGDLQNPMPTVNCTITPDSRLSLFQVRVTYSVYIIVGVPSETPISNITSDFKVVNDQNILGNANELSLTTEITHLVDFRVASFSSQPTISAGSNLTIFLEVINNGPSDSSDVIATFQIPELFGNPTSIVGFSSCTRDSPTKLTCYNSTGIRVYDPMGNQDWTFKASFNLFLPTSWSLAASPIVILDISSSDLEINISDNIAETSCNITSSYDLEIKVNDFPDPAISGTSLNYNVSWYNFGPSDISSVAIEIRFPSSIFSPGPNVYLCTLSSEIYTCQINDPLIDQLALLAPAYSGNYVITNLILNPSIKPFTSVSTNFTIKSQMALSNLTSGSTQDSNLQNNFVKISTFVVSSSDLAINVQDDGGDTVAGSTISYLFDVYNYGPSDARNATISIVLENYLSFNTSTSNLNCKQTSNFLSCNFGTFSYENGFTDTLEITLMLSSNFTNQQNVNTTWKISSDEFDPDLSNNYGSNSRDSLRYTDIYLQFLGFFARSTSTPVAGTLWDVPVFTFGNTGPSQASGLTLQVDLNTNQLSNDAVSYHSSTGTKSCTGNNGILVCVPLISTLNVGGTYNVSFVFRIDSSVADGTPLEFQVCLFSVESDPNLVDNCIYITGAYSTVEFSLSGSIEYQNYVSPAQLDTPPIVLKIQNNGPSDAANVILEHYFNPTVSLITVLPLSSENLGSIGVGQSASLSYYLNIPAQPNTSYAGAWTLSHGGFFNGNFSVYVTSDSNGDVSGLSPHLSFNFTSIVDYVCHQHLDCPSCLADPFLLCGFCESTKTCHPGQISHGPGENTTDCITWDYAYCQPSYIYNLNTSTFNVNSVSTIPAYNVLFDPVSQNFTFSVVLEYVRGGTWVLDFQKLNSKVGLTPPTGSCTNRRLSDFPSSSCCDNSTLWRSAPSAAQKRNVQKGLFPALGTTTYLSYPPPGNIWKLSNLMQGGSVVDNKVVYSTSLGFSSLFSCGTTFSSSNGTLFLTGNLYMSLVAPNTYLSLTGDKVRILSEYKLPFQFTMAAQQQLLSGITVENGASVNVLYLGQSNNLLFLRISTVVNVLGQYFGEVLLNVGGNFNLVRTFPQYVVQSPFCIPPATPSNSNGSCTCTPDVPCEQIWEFQGSPFKRDIAFNGNITFSWSLFQNYNSIGKIIKSQMNVNYVIFDTIQRVITIPIKLLFYDTRSAALANGEPKTIFSTGDSIYVFPFLDAVQRTQFNVSVDTVYICYLPNNATLLTQSQSTNNSWGCLDPRVLSDFRVTLVSGGVVNTNYALASLFNVKTYNDIYGGITFDANPLSVQPYQQYYVHGVYNLAFQNGTSVKRSVVVRASSTTSYTPGTGLDVYTMSSGKTENSTPGLTTGGIVGISISVFFFLLIIIVLILFVRRTKRKYKKFQNVQGI